jgi:hypothetical protein
MAVQFRMFRSSIKTWESLFEEAAELACQLDPRQVISISHSADSGKGVVVVWYWDKDRSRPE